MARTCISLSSAAVCSLLLVLCCCAVLVSSQSEGACINLNYQLDIPIGVLVALKQNYGSNNTGAEKNLDAAAGIQTLNVLSANQALPIYGLNTASLYNRQITYGGTCFTLNFTPVFRQVNMDVVNEPNVPKAAVLSNQNCRTDTVTPPLIAAAVDTTSVNAAQYEALAMACGGYGIPTTSMYYTNNTFQDKVAFRFASMTNPRALLEPDTLFPFLQEFKWKRVAILLSGSLTNPDLIANVQNNAAASGTTLYVQTIPTTVTTCKQYINNIVAGQWKVIFLLGSNTNLASCVVEVVHNQKLTADNYILVLGYTLLNGLTTPTIQFYAHQLNVTNAEMRGTFGFLASSSATSLGLAHQFYATRQAMTTPTPITPSLTNFYLMQDGLIHTAQGFAGMLATAVTNASAASGFTSGTSGSTAPPANPALNQITAASFSQIFFNALSTNGVYNPTNTNYTAAFSGAQQSFNVSVPFYGLRYNSANIFPYFLNSSGMAMVSTLYDKLTFDSSGYPLSTIAIYNFDGANMNHVANFDSVTNQYTVQDGQTVVWPNMNILNLYVNGIPTDSEPPMNFNITCTACNSALQPIDPATTIFAAEPNVVSAFAYNVQPNTPFLDEFEAICDGSTPLSFSTVPSNLLQMLKNYTELGAAPIQLHTGTVNSSNIAMDAALFVDAVLNIYDAFFSQVTGESDPAPIVPADANLEPIANLIKIIDGGNGAVQLSFLVNCNNGANNISTVFVISSLPQSNAYTPAGSVQIAMDVVNALALVFVVATMVTVWRNRYERVIFSSSFLFLMTILFGFVLLFVSSILSVQHASSGVCYSKLITFHFGFSLTLGSLFIKTYRLHRIFNWKSFLLVKISDWQLMIAVIGLLVVDSVVIVLWSQLSGYGVEGPTKPHCYTGGSGDTIFPAIFAGLKGLILVSGIYLTFKVRAVPANFNESAFISVVIYNTSVLALIYVVVLFAFSFSADTQATFTSILLFIAAFINFMIFFSPKILAVHQLYLNTLSNTTKNHTSSDKEHLSGGNLSARGAQKKLPPPSSDPAAAQKAAAEDDDALQFDKHTSTEYLRNRLQKLRRKFLLTVLSTKKGEADLNRFRKRCTELNDGVESGYDALRTITMDLRINMQRFQRAPTNKKERSTQQVKEDENLLQDLDDMLSVPVESIDNIDESGQSYEIIHPKNSNTSRRKSNLHSMPSSGRRQGGEQSRLNLAGTVAMSELNTKNKSGVPASPAVTYHNVTTPGGSAPLGEAAVLHNLNAVKYSFNAPFSPADQTKGAMGSARESVPGTNVETDGHGYRPESATSTSASSINHEERKGPSGLPPLSTPVLGGLDARSSVFGSARLLTTDNANSARTLPVMHSNGGDSGRRDSTPSTRNYV